MKNLFFIIALLFLFNSNINAQKPQERISISTQYWTEKNPGPPGASKDTTRTFNIVSENIDRCINKLIKVIGEPIDTGDYKLHWHNVSINGINEQLTIELHDAIGTKYPTSYMTKSFKSLEDKNKSLMNLGENTTRDTELRFLGQDGNNIAINNSIEIIIKNYLEKIMFE